MISINLAPTEELENRYWYGFDLIAFLCVGLLLFGTSRIYIWYIDNKISTVEMEKNQIEAKIFSIKKSIDRFDEIHKLIDREEKNLRSIQSITTSKITKYEPVILLEYLQTLKPEGVWLDSIQESHDKNIIMITGGAYDNVLIADFMTLLAETQHVKASMDNIRSVILEKISIDGNKTVEPKNTNPSAKFGSSGAAILETPFSHTSSNSKITQQIFPEVKGRPIFSMLLRYELSEVDVKGMQ